MKMDEEVIGLEMMMKREMIAEECPTRWLSVQYIYLVDRPYLPAPLSR